MVGTVGTFLQLWSQLSLTRAKMTNPSSLAPTNQLKKKLEDLRLSGTKFAVAFIRSMSLALLLTYVDMRDTGGEAMG